MPSPESVAIFFAHFENYKISLEKLKSAKGWSYLEIRSQLLTFRKDMVVYESICHISLQNSKRNKKVDGDDSVVYL